MKIQLRAFAVLTVSSVLVIGYVAPNKTFATVPGNNEMVSVDSSGTFENGGSNRSAISGDGKYVAYSSQATNLVSGDTNGLSDVFVRNRATGTTSRANVSSSGVQANNGTSTPQISYDGRYVVFTSSANNLVAGDTNSVEDIFVHDNQTGTTQLASRSSSGVISDGDSEYPDISADGRYIAFQSNATNLVSGVTSVGAGWQVYIKDMSTGAIRALSVNSSGTQGNASSWTPRISCDGNVVAFASDATNLVSGDTNSHQDVFVDQVGWSGTQLTNATLSGDNTSYQPDISCNGNDIVFTSAADNLVSSDTNSANDIFEYNRLTAQTTRISVSTSGAQGNGTDGSATSSVSDDGRYVVFQSSATNFDSRDAASGLDIYIRDVKSATTQLVSIDLGNHSTNGSDSASISSDGSYVAYRSSADALSYDPSRALVSGDMNGYADVFISETGF